MRDSGSGRVIAVVLALLLLVAGGVVSLKMYGHFRPRLTGGAASPTQTLQADHYYSLALRYTLAGGPGVRIDAIHLPSVAGLDLTVVGVDCKAGVANKALSEGPNLANGVYAPKLGPTEYFATIVRKIYGYKVGTPKNLTMCAVLSVHAASPGSYRIPPLTLDWRAGLFVGSVHDQTDAALTFA